MRVCAYIPGMGAGHDHSHGDARVSRMLIAAGILTVFFAIELTTALLIGSIALLADAGHMLTDLVAMFMGLTAVLLARHGPGLGGAHLWLASGRGVHRGRQRGPAVGGRRLHPLRGVRAARQCAGGSGRPDDRGGRGRPDRQCGRRVATAVALRDQPGRQGRLHGGGGRHRRQHRRADRRHRHGDHALALCRCGGGGVGRAVGAAAGHRPGPSRAAHPLGVLPRHIDVEELRSALAAVDGVTEVHDLHVGPWYRARTWSPRT